VVLDEMAWRHRSVVGSDDPEIRALADEVDRTRRSLARCLVRGAGAGRAEGDSAAAELVRALEAREQAERALAVRSAGFRHETESAAAGIDEVAAALPPSSALIAYCEYAHREGETALDQSERSLLAFVRVSGDPVIEVVRLGSASAIEEAVTQWRSAIASVAAVEGAEPLSLEAGSREAGAALRALLWDPLEPFVAGSERIFLVPDGAVHLVPFGALPAGNDGYLVEAIEGGFHVLSAERDLIPHPESLKTGQGLLALGDVDFDAPLRGHEPRPAAVVAGVGSPSIATERPRHVPYRGASPDCGGFGERVFEPLPGSSREIKDVQRIWKQAGRSRRSGSIVELRKDRAREDLFALEAKGKSVLHLATHGFVLSGCFRSRGAAPGGDRWDEVRAGRMPESPLRLSGLALAGANRRGGAERAEDDGVLTAEEIATLDLTGTDLAVLSGCETGVGDVRVGEGVLGMTRAFRIAGVRTLLYSLWPVEDRAGAAWMRAFHGARMKEGLDVPSAARRASLEVLRDLRARGEAAHPILWGGFVAAGGWR
jgi:CHAT domain-containing protein